MTAKINQKEYLKKYLSSNADGKDKKKKKKKKHSIKIIDDDFNLSKLDQDDDNVLALFDTNEDAPQIVGVIDDRPPQLIANDLKNNEKWKAIGNSENDTDRMLNNLQNTTELQRKNSKQNSISIKRKPLKPKDDDLSPERSNSNRQKTKSDVYEHIKLKREPITPDMSPPRKTTYIKLENSSSPRIHHASINSPSRYRSKQNSNNSPPRRSRRDSDNSPPRRSKRDADNSPPRRSIRDSDSSPARRRPRNDTDNSLPRRSRRDSDSSPVHRRPRKYSDNSPPRRSRKDSDSSPVRRRPRKDSDKSPPRRSRRDSDNSPAPYRGNRNSDNSTKRFQQKEPSSPPPSHSKWNLKNQSLNHKNSNNSPTPTLNNKMLKTLDGKMAGLQNAKSLHIENTEFRKRENEAFQRMSDETSGRNADVIVRDRSTGKIKDFAKEAERERQKLEKEQAKKAIYDRWGAGLKQVEDYQNRKQDEIHEMNKPLARYSNDKDLDEMLKAQERDGDPMLEYLRRKEKDNNSKRPSKPVYQGTYPENRFGIRPGYRWDGVDRSNGYETKWFDVQSKKKATEEEAYRYSTEDM